MEQRMEKLSNFKKEFSLRKLFIYTFELKLHCFTTLIIARKSISEHKLQEKVYNYRLYFTSTLFLRKEA